MSSAISLATAMAAGTLAAQEIAGKTDEKLEEVVVLGSGETFNSSAVAEPMGRQQSTITSVNGLIDNLRAYR